MRLFRQFIAIVLTSALVWTESAQAACITSGAPHVRRPPAVEAFQRQALVNSALQFLRSLTPRQKAAAILFVTGGLAAMAHGMHATPHLLNGHLWKAGGALFTAASLTGNDSLSGPLYVLNLSRKIHGEITTKIDELRRAKIWRPVDLERDVIDSQGSLRTHLVRVENDTWWIHLHLAQSWPDGEIAARPGEQSLYNGLLMRMDLNGAGVRLIHPMGELQGFSHYVPIQSESLGQDRYDWLMKQAHQTVAGYETEIRRLIAEGPKNKIGIRTLAQAYSEGQPLNLFVLKDGSRPDPLMVRKSPIEQQVEYRQQLHLGTSGLNPPAPAPGTQEAHSDAVGDTFWQRLYYLPGNFVHELGHAARSWVGGAGFHMSWENVWKDPKTQLDLPEPNEPMTPDELAAHYRNVAGIHKAGVRANLVAAVLLVISMVFAMVVSLQANPHEPMTYALKMAAMTALAFGAFSNYHVYGINAKPDSGDMVAVRDAEREAASNSPQILPQFFGTAYAHSDVFGGLIISQQGPAHWQRWNPENVKHDSVAQYAEKISASSRHLAIHVIAPRLLHRALTDGYLTPRIMTEMRENIPLEDQTSFGADKLGAASFALHFSVDHPWFDSGGGRTAHAAFVTSIEALLENKAFLNEPLGKGEAGTVTANRDWVVTGFYDDLFDRSHRFYFDEIGILFIPLAHRTECEAILTKNAGVRRPRIYYYMRSTLAEGVQEFLDEYNVPATRTAPQVSGIIKKLADRSSVLAWAEGLGTLYAVDAPWSPSRNPPNPIDRPTSGKELARMASNLLRIANVHLGVPTIRRFARSLVDEALAQDSSVGQAHYLLARLLSWDEHPQVADDEQLARVISEYETATNLGLTRIDAFNSWYQLSYLYEMIEDFTKATVALHQAAQLAQGPREEADVAWYQKNLPIFEARIEAFKRAVGEDVGVKDHQQILLDVRAQADANQDYVITSRRRFRLAERDLIDKAIQSSDKVEEDFAQEFIREMQALADGGINRRRPEEVKQLLDRLRLSAQLAEARMVECAAYVREYLDTVYHRRDYYRSAPADLSAREQTLREKQAELIQSISRTRQQATSILNQPPAQMPVTRWLIGKIPALADAPAWQALITAAIELLSFAVPLAIAGYSVVHWPGSASETIWTMGAAGVIGTVMFLGLHRLLPGFVARDGIGKTELAQGSVRTGLIIGAAYTGAAFAAIAGAWPLAGILVFGGLLYHAGFDYPIIRDRMSDSSWASPGQVLGLREEFSAQEIVDTLRSLPWRTIHLSSAVANRFRIERALKDVLLSDRQRAVLEAVIAGQIRLAPIWGDFVFDKNSGGAIVITGGSGMGKSLLSKHFVESTSGGSEESRWSFGASDYLLLISYNGLQFVTSDFHPKKVDWQNQVLTYWEKGQPHHTSIMPVFEQGGPVVRPVEKVIHLRQTLDELRLDHVLWDFKPDRTDEDHPAFDIRPFIAYWRNRNLLQAAEFHSSERMEVFKQIAREVTAQFAEGPIRGDVSPIDRAVNNFWAAFSSHNEELPLRQAALEQLGFTVYTGDQMHLIEGIKAFMESPIYLDLEQMVGWGAADRFLLAVSAVVENVSQHAGNHGALLIRFHQDQGVLDVFVLDDGRGMFDKAGQRVRIHKAVEYNATFGPAGHAGLGLAWADHYSDALKITEFLQDANGLTHGYEWRKGEAVEQAFTGPPVVPHGVKIFMQKLKDQKRAFREEPSTPAQAPVTRWLLEQIPGVDKAPGVQAILTAALEFFSFAIPLAAMMLWRLQVPASPLATSAWLGAAGAMGTLLFFGLHRLLPGFVARAGIDKTQLTWANVLTGFIIGAAYTGAALAAIAGAWPLAGILVFGGLLYHAGFDYPLIFKRADKTSAVSPLNGWFKRVVIRLGQYLLTFLAFNFSMLWRSTGIAAVHPMIGQVIAIWFIPLIMMFGFSAAFERSRRIEPKDRYLFPSQIGDMVVEYHGVFSHFGSPAEFLNPGWPELRLIPDRRMGPQDQSPEPGFVSGGIFSADTVPTSSFQGNFWIVESLDAAPRHILPWRKRFSRKDWNTSTWVVIALDKTGNRAYYAHLGTGICISVCIRPMDTEAYRVQHLSKGLAEDYRSRKATDDEQLAVYQLQNLLDQMSRGVRSAVLPVLRRELQGELSLEAWYQILESSSDSPAQIADAFRRRIHDGSTHGELEAIAEARQRLSRVPPETQSEWVANVIALLDATDDLSNRAIEELQRPFGLAGQLAGNGDILAAFFNRPTISLILNSLTWGIPGFHSKSQSHRWALQTLSARWSENPTIGDRLLNLGAEIWQSWASSFRIGPLLGRNIWIGSRGEGIFTAPPALFSRAPRQAQGHFERGPTDRDFPLAQMPLTRWLLEKIPGLADAPAWQALITAAIELLWFAVPLAIADYSVVHWASSASETIWTMGAAGVIGIVMFLGLHRWLPEFVARAGIGKTELGAGNIRTGIILGAVYAAAAIAAILGLWMGAGILALVGLLYHAGFDYEKIKHRPDSVFDSSVIDQFLTWLSIPPARRVAENQNVRVNWLTSTLSLRAFDQILSGLKPEYRAILPRIVVWPGLILPYSGYISASVPAGEAAIMSMPTLLSRQSFRWLLSFRIAQILVSRRPEIASLSYADRQALAAYLGARFAGIEPDQNGPLARKFEVLASIWLAGHPTHDAGEEDYLTRGDILKWAGMALYVWSVLAGFTFLPPSLGWLPLLPLGVLILLEIWVRWGLRASFAAAFQSPAPGLIERAGFRISYGIPHLFVALLLIMQGIQMKDHPNPSDIFTPLIHTVGQVSRLAEYLPRPNETQELVQTPTYKVTPLIAPPKSSYESPTSGEIASNVPSNWTEKYSLFQNSASGAPEFVSEMADPFFDVGDTDIVGFDGIMSNKTVYVKPEQISSFKGIQWTIDKSDPQSNIAILISIKILGLNKQFTWEDQETTNGAGQTFFTEPTPEFIAWVHSIAFDRHGLPIRVDMTVRTGNTLVPPKLKVKNAGQIRFRMKHIAIITDRPLPIPPPPDRFIIDPRIQANAGGGENHLSNLFQRVRHFLIQRDVAPSKASRRRPESAA